MLSNYARNRYADDEDGWVVEATDADGSWRVIASGYKFECQDMAGRLRPQFRTSGRRVRARREDEAL